MFKLSCNNFHFFNQKLGFSEGTSLKHTVFKVFVKIYRSISTPDVMAGDNWDKVLKNGPSKICGKQPLKNLMGYGLLKGAMSLEIF